MPRRPRAFAFDCLEPRVALDGDDGQADVGSAGACDSDAWPQYGDVNDPSPIEDEPGDFANGNPPGAFIPPAPIGPAGPAF